MFLFNFSTVLPNSWHEHGGESLVGAGLDLHLGDEDAPHEHSHAVLTPRNRRVVAARQPVHMTSLSITPMF